MQHPKHTMQATELSRPRKQQINDGLQQTKVAQVRQHGGDEDVPFAQGVVSHAAEPTLNPTLRVLTFLALLSLFVLCIAWELWLDPMVAGGSIYFLKALPLMFALHGVFKGNIYTMQCSSLLVLIYILEGAVRGYSDLSALSRCLGRIEFSLALVAFLSAIFYVRPAKKWAKAQKK